MPASSFAQCEKRFFIRLRERGWTPRVVYDIGAAHGKWSAVIADALPEAQYELFEPLASRSEAYRAHLEQTCAQHPNFRVHEVALSDHNGDAAFWASKDDYSSSLLAHAGPADQRTRVPVRRLDDLVAEMKLPQPQALKLDVQGGEALVLTGGPRTIAGADLLHLETWLVRGYGAGNPLLTELMPALERLGFILVHLGDFYREPKQRIASVDAFFAHERLIQRFAAEEGGFPWGGEIGA